MEHSHNVHKQKLKGLLTRAGRRIPRWLERSAGSVLESTATMLEENWSSVPRLREEATSTPGRREETEERERANQTFKQYVQYINPDIS